MSIFSLQPSFVMHVPYTADETVRRLRAAIADPEFSGLAQSAGRVVELKITAAERRFWSPHLSVQIGNDSLGQTTATDPAGPVAHLVGRFSPRPEIWTMFMAAYLSTTFCIASAAVWGYVQWFMGNAPWALLGIPIGVVIVLALHAMSLTGQSLSRDQMELLRDQFHAAMQSAFDDLSSPDAVGNRPQVAAAIPIAGSQRPPAER